MGRPFSVCPGILPTLVRAPQLRCLRALLPALLLSGAGCEGPSAPDSAVCQDTIARLCAPPLCGAMNGRLPADCQSELLDRTGCGADEFTFQSPERVRFLRCRLPLLRAGPLAEDHPWCDDVSEVFDRCPDVRAFLLGAGP